MQELGVGVIGFGFMGKAHTYGYRNIPLFYDPVPVRTRLVGVATSRPETARKAAEQGGFEFGTADWRELIARDDIRIVNICSPNSAHAEQLVATIGAGKHVYCDKPVVVTDADAERVAKALCGYRGTSQVTFNNRFMPAALRAKQLVDEGFLGNVISFRASYLHSGSVDPAHRMGWKQQASSGGGVIQDLASHIVDLVDWLAGPFAEVVADLRVLYPERPNARGEMEHVEADDQTTMIVRTKTGAVGTIEASKIATGADDEVRFEINGDRGAIRYSLMDPNYLEAYDLREPEGPIGGQRGWRRIATVQRYEKPSIFPSPKSGVGWLRGHMHCLCSFLAAVAEGRPGDPSLERGLHVQVMLSAIARSAETRSWQPMPERRTTP